MTNDTKVDSDDPKVHKDTRVLLDIKVLIDRSDHSDIRVDSEVHKVHRVINETKDIKDIRDIREIYLRSCERGMVVLPILQVVEL